MRVLHIGKFYPPYPGGIERSSADLCAALAARDVDVAMLAHAAPGQSTRNYMEAGVDVTLAACHGQLLYAPLSPGFPLLLNRSIAEHRPDLLHLHLPNVSAFWALLSPAARRVPWIVHWHADVPLDIRRAGVRATYRLYRPFEQALLKRAHAVIATSAPYCDSSTALAPWRDKITVIPLGIGSEDTFTHVDKYTPPATQNAALWPASTGTGLRILAVGRLSYYKGFDVLLRALAQTRDASLLLIGGGECEAQLKAVARDLDIEARVHFAGHVDDATLARAYGEAQVFCLPSIERTEAFGMVLLEAMRARLPVIASAIPGSGVNYVVDEGSGVLVPPGDAGALGHAFARMAESPELRERLGTGGAARWREEFTLDRFAQRVLALYRSVVPEAAHHVAASPTN
jgi:glycosyltransferase involved in cell wall biosynthesis